MNKSTMKNSLLFCSFATLSMVACTGPKQSKPNVIMILADDLGYSDPGYLDSKIKTPNLNRLRDEGMLLERCYVQPQCTPTRVALLTGCYPYRFGMHEHVEINNNTGIPEETKTIAEKMKEGGYATSVIGKWHVGKRRRSFWPPYQGFDHSFIMSSADYWNYDVYKNGELYDRNLLKDESGGNNRYSTYVWAEEAVNVIKNHNKDKPFFMYLPFSAPHAPLQAPDDLIEIYEKMEIDDYWANSVELGRNRENRIIYMAMVDALDRAIGNLLEALREEKMLDNTLIVFHSDNGPIPEGDARPLRSYKGDSYEGGIRTSAIVWWPGKVKKASSSNELVYVGDWYPTFAEISGMEWKNEDIDGVSALRVLTGGKSQRKGIPVISAARHAYITKDYSLVGQGGDYYSILQSNFSGFQLFEINKDVSQQKPLQTKPRVESELKSAFRPFFEKVNQGRFNWDVRFANKYRPNMNIVLNDKPEITTGKSLVTVSPVENEFVYILKGTKDGKNWSVVDEFVCREKAGTFSFNTQPGFIHYEVDIDFHNGWPVYETFSFENYMAGKMFSANAYHEEELFPLIDGLLPIADAVGAKNISITEKSLAYKNWPEVGGAIQLTKRMNTETQTAVSRYFYVPASTGKVYISMLVKCSTKYAESQGEINLLRQNDTETAIVTKLSFSRDGVFLEESGNGNRFPKTRLTDYNQGEIACILYELDLGTIGQDTKKVYINPDKDKLTPDAFLKGEFTFDRLQFQLNGRESGEMVIDEIRVSRKLDDVLF